MSYDLADGNKVGITLIVKDKASMGTHHILSYNMVSHSDDSIDAVYQIVETDDSTSARDLKLRFYDGEGRKMPYVFETYLPTRKITLAQIPNPIMKGEKFSYTVEYDAPETDRYYQYYCQEKIIRLTCLLDYPNDLPPKSRPHGTPTALKVINLKRIESSEVIYPVIRTGRTRSKAEWSIEGGHFGLIYRFRW